MAFGNTVKINGNFSYGLGRYLKTNANYSMVIGHGMAGSGLNPDMFLENNSENSLKVGFNSTRATLSVSSSPNDYPGNGGSTDRTGKVAIGDVPIPDIAAKLHIRSDTGEDAGLFLEPSGKNGEISFIKMTDDNHRIDVLEDGVMRITTGSNGLAVSSANANLTGTELVLGGQPTPRINLTADGRGLQRTPASVQLRLQRQPDLRPLATCHDRIQPPEQTPHGGVFS